jgi:hypothetical protein
MRPVEYSVMAVLLFWGSMFLPMPDAPSGIDSVQIVASSQGQAETLNQLLQDLQDVARVESLDPQQRAEIKSLLSQTRLLLQQLQDSPAGFFQPRHRKQLQEIKLRFDAIKNALPTRPVIRKQPTAIVLSPAPSPNFGWVQSSGMVAAFPGKS